MSARVSVAAFVAGVAVGVVARRRARVPARLSVTVPDDLAAQTTDLADKFRAHLDWADAYVESSRGGDAAPPERRTCGPIRDDECDAADAAEVDRGPVEVDDLLDALTNLVEAVREGRTVLVLTQPDLVSAVLQLLDHGSSPLPVDVSGAVPAASETEGRGERRQSGPVVSSPSGAGLSGCACACGVTQ